MAQTVKSNSNIVRLQVRATYQAPVRELLNRPYVRPVRKTWWRKRIDATARVAVIMFRYLVWVGGIGLMGGGLGVAIGLIIGKMIER